MARSTFRFRLQRLLEIRRLREQLAQAELIARRTRLQAEEAVLARLMQEEQDLIDRMTARPGQAIDVQDRWSCERFVELKRKEQVAQQAKIRKAQQVVDEQVVEVRQRGIDVKALEKLEEKQREEHRLDQLREESYFMDDLASQGYLRRAKQEADDLEDAMDAAAADLQLAPALDEADSGDIYGLEEPA